MVTSTGVGKLGCYAGSRCLTSIIVAGLVFGSGLMSHGRAAAAGFERGTGSFQGDERGRFAVTAQPVDFPAATGESEKQTDSETLDAGAPPPATSTTTSAAEDVETLDQGSPPVTSSGPPPAEVTSPPVGSVAGTYVAPVSLAEAPSYAAPSVTTGPAIPPDFGTGHVHVGAGVSEFPVGLASCHVGTITGRAYVGVDCPNGDSVVGFAPSLNDFPFVLQADFPFEGDEGFLIDAARAEAEASDAGSNNVDVLASMPNPQTDSSTSETQIGVAGASSLQFAQKSHTTPPTVESGTSLNTSKQSKTSKQSSGGNSSTRTQNANQGKGGGSGRAYGLSMRQTAHVHQRHRQDRKRRTAKRVMVTAEDTSTSPVTKTTRATTKPRRAAKTNQAARIIMAGKSSRAVSVSHQATVT